MQDHFTMIRTEADDAEFWCVQDLGTIKCLVWEARIDPTWCWTWHGATTWCDLGRYRNSSIGVWTMPNWLPFIDYPLLNRFPEFAHDYAWLHCSSDGVHPALGHKSWCWGVGPWTYDFQGNSHDKLKTRTLRGKTGGGYDPETRAGLLGLRLGSWDHPQLKASKHSNETREASLGLTRMKEA